MHYKRLLEFFDARRRRQQPLVLATVFDTRGSTYSKAGARMLIDAEGIFRGMLSGGCLEGDLAIRARQVIESGRPQVAIYDLASDDDELWGLGVGCDGMMRVFLQPLTDTNSYQPYAKICELEAGDLPAAAATVISSDAGNIPAGATVVFETQSTHRYGLDAQTAQVLQARCDELSPNGEAVLETLCVAGHELEILYSPVEPVPRILVLGAGLDAEPLFTFLCELGWLCTVVDHRPAYLDNKHFDMAEHRLCCPANDLHRQLDLERFDMAVIMSHHLASDRLYLEQLANTQVAYIGLLGPAGRRARLLDELGESADLLRGRLHGPAGLDLGGRGPAAIALSIAAEMQRVQSSGALRHLRSPAKSSE